MGEEKWNPWEHMREHYPHVTVELVDLPDGVLGEWRGDCIRLNRRSTTAQQASTLAHEIVHLERGLPPAGDPYLLAQEEAVCDAIAARRMVPLEVLVDAVRWGQGIVRHTDVGVDTHLLIARVRGLTDEERSILSAAARQPAA